jgi:hypothetical protein
LNLSETAHPNRANAERYRGWQEIQDDLSRSLRPLFQKHRRFTA